MLATTLIRIKRDGGTLNAEQWRFLTQAFCDGRVTDPQMAALAMAICIRGLTPEETSCLTTEMLASGSRLPRVTDRPRVDKHSTGGLGDKVSLILAPLLASVGCDVPMISGRGLGRTGGTLDKLESIEGFQTSLSVEHSSRVLRQAGAFIMGADASIAPADRKLYALRDVTATVESIGLITASILSKKLAASLDALVMDVKVGAGGFMPTIEQASELAESLVRVGGQSGLPTRAILSDMDQPLGNFRGASIGNAIEVNEAIEVMDGTEPASHPSPVRDLTILLATESLLQVGLFTNADAAAEQLRARLASGQVMERFETMIAAQGGTLTKTLPLHRRHEFCADADGHVAHLDCPAIGDFIIAAGGGRRQGGESIDHRVGVQMHVRVGDVVTKGQPLFAIFTESAPEQPAWVRIQETPVEPLALVRTRIPPA